jgi:hypothetical protein
MKISKDISVTNNDNGGVEIFSWSLGKSILVNADELIPLIEALQLRDDITCPACGGRLPKKNSGLYHACNVTPKT